MKGVGVYLHASIIALRMAPRMALCLLMSTNPFQRLTPKKDYEFNPL